MEATRFAIWQRNMVAVVTAFIIWAANGAFFIQSKSSIVGQLGHPSNLVMYRYLAGKEATADILYLRANPSDSSDMKRSLMASA